jgi:flagellar motor switch protein FliG
MTIIVIGLFFILIWLGTTFFIVRYIKRLKSDLLKMFSDDESVYKPFDFINRADPKDLLFLIQYEHPQVIALVLSYLEPKKASFILRNLYQEQQSDVARRIAIMDQSPPEVIREIERVLEKKLSTLSGEDYSVPGGVESIVEILNLAGHDSVNQIIKRLEDEDPELAEVIKDRVSTLRKPCGKIFGKLKGKAIEVI